MSALADSQQRRRYMDSDEEE